MMNLTIVYLTAKSGNELLIYNLIFWNDEPAMIILAANYSTAGTSSASYTSVDELLQKYVELLGRGKYLDRYKLVRKDYVSGRSHTVEIGTYIEAPANNIYVGLLMVRARDGVPVEIFDHTYIVIQGAGRILGISEVTRISDKALPNAMKALHLDGKIRDRKVTYLLKLRDQKKFLYGFTAQVDYYFDHVLDNGIYGLTILVDAVNGRVESWSILGAFGLVPYTNPVERPNSAGNTDGTYSFSKSRIVINPLSDKGKPSITVNYHYPKREAKRVASINTKMEQSTGSNVGLIAIMIIIGIVISFTRRFISRKAIYTVILIPIILAVIGMYSPIVYGDSLIHISFPPSNME